MGFYTAVVYPAVLAGFLLLFCVAGLTFVWTGLHRWLERAVTLMWVASAVQAFLVGGLLVGGRHPDSLVTAIGYLVVSLALLPLLGIGRLGLPDEGPRREPDRPVLTPRQIALVDAVAAMVLAVALAVVAWRLHEVMAGAGR